MSNVIKKLYELALQHGVMINISLKPCCGSAFLSIKINRSYIDENESVYTEFIVNQEATEEEYKEIEETFKEMLEDV